MLSIYLKTSANKYILRCGLSPGDIVLLTAAVRDLHRDYPDQYLTDLRTSCPEIWENNPYLTPLADADPNVTEIDCSFPLINRSNTAPYHVIHGFIAHLKERLELNIKPTEFKGDIHLSEGERSWPSQVEEIVGREIPFWLVVAGGKYDVTIKWWEAKRYQQVIDHFRGKIQFVQVGVNEHYHPDLEGVIDLRGKTSLRELIRLVYHSQGVLCPVTCVMHLAAAVPVKGRVPKHRPCVVIAGGREPSQWESYPHHQFIHTNGALLCCDNGGCWKSRTVPIGDGDERDRPENLCVDVVGSLPRCMDMITADEVIHRIERYFAGGAIRYLTAEEARAARRAVRIGNAVGWDRAQLERRLFRRAAEEFIRSIRPYPGGASGRGIVICGGGPIYLPCAWVCIRMLRHLGCRLPVELWQLNEREMSSAMEERLSGLEVRCINAEMIREKHPIRVLHGWGLKPYALLQSSFQEILYLDADNVPLVDPEFLFETPQFGEIGAIFWPDYGRLSASRSIWKICGVAYRDEPEFETGQIVLDKRRCWRSLSLTLWYNEHSDFYYEHVYGDKETFHMAFRKLGKPYAMPATPIYPLLGTMCQHDFDGRRIFQHRNRAKWLVAEPNPHVNGFVNEDLCLSFLSELQPNWIPDSAAPESQEADADDSPNVAKPPARSVDLRANTVTGRSDSRAGNQRAGTEDRDLMCSNRTKRMVATSGEPSASALRVLQIATTHEGFCGVANFAQNLSLALRKLGVQIRTSARLDEQNWADVVLVHFESGMISPAHVKALCRGLTRPFVLFAHSAGAAELAFFVDGFIAMRPDIVRSGNKPMLVIDHPAFAPSVLSERGALKRAYGLTSAPVVVGSSGLLLGHRNFAEIVSMLAPIASDCGWLIYVLLAPHFTTPSKAVTELDELRSRFSENFIFDLGFVPNWELNSKLQACDLLWCWTSNPSHGYASGVISDMYASGTRVVAASKKQHEHVLRLPNVVAAPDDLNGFLDTLISEIRGGNFQRHDPSAISWDKAAAKILNFLQVCARKQQPITENLA